MKEHSKKEVAFFGKITAGITHEMKNVLAIIKESAGLIEDILSLSKKGAISHEEKIQQSLDRIKDQVKRGVNLSDRLNGFAHSTDESPATVILSDMVQRLAALSERFLRQKNAAVILHIKEKSDPLITVESHPVLLQMAFFECILVCMERMQSGGNIQVEIRKNDRNATIKTLCETGDSDGISSSERWPALQEMAKALNAFVEPDDSGRGICLTLPDSID